MEHLADLALIDTCISTVSYDDLSPHAKVRKRNLVGCLSNDPISDHNLPHVNKSISMRC